MFTLILIGLVTFLFFTYFKIKYSYWERRGVKGPRPIPIFGTIFEENLTSSKDIEEKFFREYGKVFGTYLGTQPILNVSDPQLVKMILSDLKTFPSMAFFQFPGKYLANSMFFKNGLDWKSTRAAQTHYFTSRKLKNLFVHFEQVSSNFIENLETCINDSKNGDVEVKKLSKFYGIDTIAKVLFAMNVNSFKEQDTILVKAATSTGNVDYLQTFLATILPKSLTKFFGINALNLKPLDKLGDYFVKLLEERRKSGIKYNDLSEILQNARIEGDEPLTQQEIIGNILLAFFAGVEPVSNAVSQMLYYLAEYPNVQEKLYDEIKKEFSEEIDYEKLTRNQYLDAVLNEVLRLSVSFMQVVRTAAKDTKVGDLEIEKGTEINCIFYISHITSDQYLDPYSFNPERFLKSSNNFKTENANENLFAPFGYGPKQCIGMRLALIETKYLFVRLLQKYEICKAKDLGIVRAYFRGFTGVEAINVAFKKRV